MKNYSFESLKSYLLSDKLEIYEVLKNDKKISSKYRLVSINGVSESNDVFYFNDFKIIAESLKRGVLREEENLIGNAIDPFLGKEVDGRLLINSMAKKILRKDNPEMLGKPGGHGAAYVFKPEKAVLKISDDQKEAENSILLLGKSNKRLANIYNVYIIKYGNENPQIWYAIIMEFLKDVTLASTLGKTSGGENAWATLVGVEPNMVGTHKACVKAKGDSSKIEEQKDLFINFDEKTEINSAVVPKLLSSPKLKTIEDIKKGRAIMFEMIMELIENETKFTNDYIEPKNIGVKVSNNKIGYFDLGGKVSGEDKSNNPTFDGTGAKEYRINQPLL